MYLLLGDLDELNKGVRRGQLKKDILGKKELAVVAGDKSGHGSRYLGRRSGLAPSQIRLRRTCSGDKMHAGNASVRK